LHEAGDGACAGLVARHNDADRRLREAGDAKRYKTCRPILAQQFHRDCARQLLASATDKRGCYKVFQRFERNHASDVRRSLRAGMTAERCS